jgi:hypothetical protein
MTTSNLLCSNCGYWHMNENIVPFQQVFGRCNCFKGPKYLNQTTATDKCTSWGPEGGRGPGAELVACGTHKPSGTARPL